MNEISSGVTLILQSSAAAANIFLIANSVGLPLKNIENIIRYSPFTIFFFVLSFAMSTTTGFIPAALGTIIYFYLEFDEIIHKELQTHEKSLQLAVRKTTE